MPLLRRLLLALTPALALLTGCGGDSASVPAVIVEISPVAGSVPLAAGDTVETPAGDRLEVRRLQFYLSRPRLLATDGRWVEAPSDPASDRGYALFDLARPEQWRFRLPSLPAGDYSGLAFTVGVDAERNHAGAQTGVLDPARGMFWTWASGYIHFKLEGRSPASTEADQAVSLHLGGDGASRTVFLAFAPKPLRIRDGLQPTVHLQADLAAFLGGAEPLSFAQQALVMGAPDALPLADRLGRLLRVDHLHHEPATVAAR